MAEQDNAVVVPVVREELHADAVPVVTGGVRVTKRIESHDEVVEQELRKSRVEVKRVKTDRVVDGPQQPRRQGNTLIIPVVEEVLRVEKSWVLSEEIHITEIEERETVQNTVTLMHEEAQVERVDAEGTIVSSIDERSEVPKQPAESLGILPRPNKSESATKAKALGRTRSILKDRHSPD